MDYEQLSREIVRSLRGPRSQAFCNRRLKYSTNVMHAWETGTRYPCTSDLFKLARIVGVDVQEILRSFVSDSVHFTYNVYSPVGVKRWLEILTTGRSAVQIAGMIGRNRNTVSRWLKGISEPRFPDLLRLVKSTTQRLLEFVGAMVDPQGIGCLAETFADFELQRRLAYEMPWSHAVLRVLELEDYQRIKKYSEGYIAARIGISIEEERSCIDALATAKQIRFHNGRWVNNRVLTVDTRNDPEANRRLKCHWAEVAITRLRSENLSSHDLFSYNLFAISDEGLSRIRKAHLNYFEQLRSIVADCENPSRVVLANLQLFALEGEKE